MEEKVGESSQRNREFEKRFTRESIIALTLENSGPMPYIFDVGAHVGESIIFFRRLFPDALIYSFEPDPDSFSRLKKLADNKTIIFNIALSDEEGIVDFYRNAADHTNSLLPVNINSKDSIYLWKVRSGQEKWDPNRFNERISIVAKRLDRFCAEKGIEHVDLLKIDVQGAEDKVLRGGGEHLKYIDNIILEISFYDYYNKRSSFYEVESIIRLFGFKLFAITEISNNPMNGRIDWAEALYTK